MPGWWSSCGASPVGSAILLIAAAFLALAGTVCAWAWLICLGRGAERLAARPAAIFAVVLFVLAAMSAGAAMAQTAPHHHHEFHQDFYRYWKQPGTGVSCCDASPARGIRLLHQGEKKVGRPLVPCTITILATAARGRLGDALALACPQRI